MHSFTNAEIDKIDPDHLMAVLGKRVLHPGGWRSTEELLQRADFRAGQRVLDIGCGVGTTALEITRHFRVRVTAADISLLMVECAHANVSQSELGTKVVVEQSDILSLPHADNSFDRVLAEAVVLLVDRPTALRELVRVCKSGGRVLATEFFWRNRPTINAQRYVEELSPGLRLDPPDYWARLHRAAGLTDVQTTVGPFELMTPSAFLRDEGLKNSLALMGRAFTRLAYLKRMLWLMPRIWQALPYLGYIVISGVKPA
jgi:SAM-dependent methyltransferase